MEPTTTGVKDLRSFQDIIQVFFSINFKFISIIYDYLCRRKFNSAVSLKNDEQPVCIFDHFSHCVTSLIHTSSKGKLLFHKHCKILVLFLKVHYLKYLLKLGIMSWRLFSKISKVALGSAGGISIYCLLNSNESKLKTVHNSWTTNHKPSLEWDFNWDHRACTSLVKPLSKDASPEKENAHNEKLDKHRSKAVRHIILIRHGQYNLNGATDKERILTELGRAQAKLTGQRLAELKIPIDDVVISTMTRAQETGNIILDQLPHRELLSIQHDSLIEEGAPIPPEPKVGHWRPEPSVRYFLSSSLSFLKVSFFFSSSFKTVQELKLVSHQRVGRRSSFF